MSPPKVANHKLDVARQNRWVLMVECFQDGENQCSDTVIHIDRIGKLVT